MTDETTARDRVDDALWQAETWTALPDANGTAKVLAAEVRRLRALAGAPTADVAAEPVASNVRGAADWLLYFYADPSHQGEDDQTAAAYWALGDDLAGKLIDAFRELARLRAAAPAPEGVDAADELHVIPLAYEADGSMYDEPCTRRAGCGSGTHQLSCPEPDEPDGMDLEAEGEMSDQLAAAQAAIQRVRDLCQARYDAGYVRSCLVDVDDLRRALDGEIKPHYPEAFEGGQRLCPEGRGDCECLDVEGR